MPNADGMQPIADKYVSILTRNADMSKKCSYGTGGKADYYFAPDCDEVAGALISDLKKADLPYFILGGGSDVLVSDDGYRGAVVSTEKLKSISLCGRILTAGAGVKISELVKFALYSSLGGIEFLSGIPATVGGVVTMNAGCFGKSVADRLSYVVTTDGIYPAKDCGFSYRESLFKKNGECVLKAAFRLDNAEYEQSESKIEYYKNLRRSKQPKGRSCGSVFLNDGCYAGRTIESCNLKGRRVGGARVSEKHANFIIADADCKSEDIYSLINEVRKTVREKTGTELREDLVYLGRFGDENKF